MNETEKRPDMNSRRFRREGDRTYLILVILTLVVVGGALIALIFGPVAMLAALPFLLGGAGLILLPWLLFSLLERWRDQMEEGDEPGVHDLCGQCANVGPGEPVPHIRGEHGGS